MLFHCGMCDDSFATRPELDHHTANHPDTKLPAQHCPVCQWPFDDQLALEAHQRTSEHPTPLSDTSTAVAITCGRCSNDFTSHIEYKKHRSWPNGTCADFKNKKTTPKTQAPMPTYAGYDHPAMAVQDAELGHDDVTTNVSNAATSSDDKPKCTICQKEFRSLAQYNNHFMGCQPAPAHNNGIPVMLTIPSEAPPAPTSRQLHHTLKVQVPVPVAQDTTVQVPTPMQTVTIKTKPPVQRQTPATGVAVQPPSQAQSLMLPAATSNAIANVFACQKPGCGKVLKSAPALKVHDGDVHGIGGQKLDLHGRDSWMLGSRERERLRAEGLLRGSPASVRGRGGRQPPSTIRSVAARPTVALKAPPTAHHQPRPPPPGSTMSTGTKDGGPADMEQARIIQGKILRLLIQSDIYITDYGKLIACGIKWTRIGTSVQHEVISRIESMIHLPKALKDEYVPFPKAFSEEYKYSYPPGDFKTSPIRDHLKPGLSAIALACNKVLLADGAQEVVKVAAVDLVTCRILMNHLVCTSPHAAVADWRSQSTGILAWRDMEHARTFGYKIFKGWSAVRCALHKFIDKDTVIVGHNLRSDLDALRMIHGRAIDITKVFEKAANGPLTKTQLGLDGLSKKLLDTQLRDDPEHGRDVLMNAFAARQFVLWASKNSEALNRAAKQTSLDLQRAGLRS